MSNTLPPGLAALRAAAARVVALLDDAQPGLMSWMMMLGRAIEEVTPYDGKGTVEKAAAWDKLLIERRESIRLREGAHGFGQRANRIVVDYCGDDVGLKHEAGLR